MTATLTAFDATTREIKLRLDAMPPSVTTGDIWIAYAEGDKCVWDEDMDGNYETGCGNVTCGMEDGSSPVDHGMAYCPFCGRLFTVTHYSDPNDEEES